MNISIICFNLKDIPPPVEEAFGIGVEVY